MKSAYLRVSFTLKMIHFTRLRAFVENKGDPSTILTVHFWGNWHYLKSRWLVKIADTYKTQTRPQGLLNEPPFWKSSRSRPWIRGWYKMKQNGVILGWKEVTNCWILALLQWRTLFLLVYFTTCSLWSGDLHCTRRRNCSSIMFFWSPLESVLMIPSSWTCRRIFRNAQIWKRPLKNVMQLQLT